MPILDFPLERLETYTGLDPCPDGFDDFWRDALGELDAVDPQARMEPCRTIHSRNSELFDLWFRGVGGARIHAKYARPRHIDAPCPAVLQFHGYTMDSGDWADLLAWSGEGFCVAALDCRGQGGLSEDVGGVMGNTQRGHIIRGLDEGPEKLLYRAIYLDTAQLVRVVMGRDEVDPARVATMGGSQGGALSLVCAALEPAICRAVSCYPFLSDFRRVWEMDLAKQAYEELAWYFKFKDPTHSREEEIFRTLSFIDIRHLVPRIRADVLMAITLLDSVCPPSTQFAAFNAITSPKQKIVYPDFGHEALGGMRDATLNFLNA